MRRRAWIATAAAAALVVGVGVGITVGRDARETPDTPGASKPTRIAVVTPTPAPADVPAAPSQAALARLPLAYHDAVVPQLLDGSQVGPEDTWQRATPKAPLVALYASTDADARPVAALSHLVSTIDRPTATAVWGRSPGADGGMLLVSTPARNRTPGDGGNARAPSATFAWARAVDFTVTATDRAIRVDTATSTVSVVDRAGRTIASEPARLGTPEDPTPIDTATYVEAAYVDARVTYTQGNPIILTGRTPRRSRPTAATRH
ncbi:hypothetical protein P9139_16055 [Curtobacterium flaccumfaciens]|nr:hypothetical protein P9139_16055 [Curtobacterium flaccumfaciens]